MSAFVSVNVRTWSRLAHGARHAEETDYTVLLHGKLGGSITLRKISTCGDMGNGYFGSGAKREAKAYSRRVATVLGQGVVPFWKRKDGK